MFSQPSILYLSLCFPLWLISNPCTLLVNEYPCIDWFIGDWLVLVPSCAEYLCVFVDYLYALFLQFLMIKLNESYLDLAMIYSFFIALLNMWMTTNHTLIWQWIYPFLNVFSYDKTQRNLTLIWQQIYPLFECIFLW